MAGFHRHKGKIIHAESALNFHQATDLSSSHLLNLEDDDDVR